MTEQPTASSALEPTFVLTPVTDAAQVSALLESINQEILGALLKQFQSASELAKSHERA